MAQDRFPNLQMVAQAIQDNNKPVTLLYAFNATGKTRLSMEFKNLVNGTDEMNGDEDRNKRVIYYNAFTEDLFYWDNDLSNDAERRLRINLDSKFVEVIKNQGKNVEIVDNFQYYTASKITPIIDLEKGEVRFNLTTGDALHTNIKISKGEANIFIFSMFLTLVESVIAELKQEDLNDRSTDEFNDIEYIYIDDPITSLDDNHVFDVAQDIKKLVRSGRDVLKFIISTHHSLFYTILDEQLKNALKRNSDKISYTLERVETEYLLTANAKAAFGYHLYIKNTLTDAITTNTIQKYHFSLFRNLLEKTATYLGYDSWKDCLVGSLVDNESKDLVATRINNYCHNKHSILDGVQLQQREKNMLKTLFKDFETHFNWKKMEE